jgi:hypothetical protein
MGLFTLQPLRGSTRLTATEFTQRREAVLRRRRAAAGLPNAAPPEDAPSPIPLPEASARSLLALGQVLIGQETETGLRVLLESAVRDQGLYVPGKNGMGKSTLLLNLILADILMGRGLVLLDPHQDLVQALLPLIPEERAGDVVVLDALDPEWSFGLNIYACEHPDDERAVQDTVTRALHLFTKLWGDRDTGQLGPRMSQYLRNAARVLIANRLTLCELPRLLTDAAYRDTLLPTCSARVQQFWAWHDSLTPREQQANVESSYNKAEEFASNAYIWPIVGQAGSRLVFRTLIDRRKIVLVKLSAEHEDLTRLVGSLIVMELLKAAQSRADTARSERVPFGLYVDEFDYFATPDFATLLKGGRKFGVCTTLAHQEQSRLDRELLGSVLQVGNLICFAVNGLDAEVLAKHFDNRSREDTPELKPMTHAALDERGRLYQRPLFDYEYRHAYRPGRFGGIEESEQEAAIPRYRYERRLKPVAEAEHETANELATLPPYHAKVRLRMNPRENLPRFLEHTLRTPTAPEPPDSAEATARVASLIERSRHTYCRRREEVEAEITERQYLSQNARDSSVPQSARTRWNIT